MTKSAPAKSGKAAPRKPRADASRNRERLLGAAKQALAKSGGQMNLEEIARLAGVGIGTLYRHFPTREALLAEVYRAELEELCAAATRLAESEPPMEALRDWMHLFVDYAATKRLVRAALAAAIEEAKSLYPTAREDIRAAIMLLTDRAVAAGLIRLDLDPMDLLRALIGVSASDDPAQRRHAARQITDILLRGLSAPAPRR